MGARDRFEAQRRRARRSGESYCGDLRLRYTGIWGWVVLRNIELEGDAVGAVQRGRVVDGMDISVEILHVLMTGSQTH